MIEINKIDTLAIWQALNTKHKENQIHSEMSMQMARNGENKQRERL